MDIYLSFIIVVEQELTFGKKLIKNVLHVHILCCIQSLFSI